MTTTTAVNIMLFCLFVIGFVLWLDSPYGLPRDGKGCNVKRCRWHRK